MTTITLKHPAALTRDQYDHCYSDGQRHFWVAHKGPEDELRQFVPIGTHCALQPISVTLNMAPGRYVLGCGSGRQKLRRVFEVDLLGYRFL